MSNYQGRFFSKSGYFLAVFISETKWVNFHFFFCISDKRDWSSFCSKNVEKICRVDDFPGNVLKMRKNKLLAFVSNSEVIKKGSTYTLNFL